MERAPQITARRTQDLRKVRNPLFSLDSAIQAAWKRDFPRKAPEFAITKILKSDHLFQDERLDVSIAQTINYALNEAKGVQLMDAGHYRNRPFKPDVIRIITDYPRGHRIFPLARKETVRQDNEAIRFLSSVSRQLQAEELAGGKTTDLVYFIDGPVTGRLVYEDAFFDGRVSWAKDPGRELYWTAPEHYSASDEVLLDAVVQNRKRDTVWGIPTGSIPLLNRLGYQATQTDADVHLVQVTQKSDKFSPLAYLTERIKDDRSAYHYIAEMLKQRESENLEIGRDADVLAIHLSDGLETAASDAYLDTARKHGLDIASVYVPRQDPPFARDKRHRA